MTQRQLRELHDGDLIQSRVTDMIYLVTGNYGTHATAVQTVDVEDADEWYLVAKAMYPKGVQRKSTRDGTSYT